MESFKLHHFVFFNKDFKKIPTDKLIKKITLSDGSEGLLKILKNGYKVIRRLATKTKDATLELQKKGTIEKIKVRYK